MLQKLSDLPFGKLSLILLLWYFFSFSFRSDNSFDQDLGRHIRLGEIISQSWSVPKTNLFSYTNPDFPFVNHHFLFEVFVFHGQNLVGIEGLLVIKILILLLSIYLTLSIFIYKSPLISLVISFIFLHTFRERVELRPEIFSFLFTALSYKILELFSSYPKTKLIYLLPLIQLLWVNTHIYFPVGFLLQGIFLVELLYQNKISIFKKLLIVSIVSTILSLINPNFIKGFLYPLTIFGNYGYSIVENQTLFFLERMGFESKNHLFVKLSALIIVASLIIPVLKKRLELRNLLTPILGLILALVHVRSFPYLVLLSLPGVILNLKLSYKNSFLVLIWTITAFILIYESIFYLNGDYYKYTNQDRTITLNAPERMKGSLDYVLSNNLKGPIFNNFDIGSYIFYRAYPNLKVFVDGRPEAYPKQFFSDLYIPIQSDPQKFSEYDKQVNFQTIIFSHTDQTPWGQAFLTSILKNPSWGVVYIDDFGIVLTKNSSLNIDLNKLTPNDYPNLNHLQNLRLSLFLYNHGYLDSSRQFAQKSLQLFPDNLIAQQLVGGSFNSYAKPKRDIWW